MVDLPGVPSADDEDELADQGIDGATWLARAGVPDPGPLGERPAAPRALLLAPLVAGGVVAGVGGAAVGATGVVAGLLAGAVVLAFFAGGALPLQLSQAFGDVTGMGLVLLLTNYAFRVALALLVPLVLVGTGWADRGVTGVGVIVCALVRVNAQVLLMVRSQHR